jgi:hypothetical protein
LAVVSRQTIELEIETRRLAVLPVEGFPIIRHWFILHRRDKRMSAASQAFRDLMLSQVSPQPLIEPPSPAARPTRGAYMKKARQHRLKGSSRRMR